MLTIYQKILVVGLFFISFSLILEAQGELFTIEWVSQFGTDGPDVATDIFSNSDGIYVVGATGDTLISREGTLSDAFVSLYNKGGRELWTKQFGTDKVDRVNGVIADSSGVYVVGRTDGKLSNTSFGSGDAFLRKYDTNGMEIWTKQFGTPDMDIANGVTVDSSGVYVVGRTDDPFTGQKGYGLGDVFIRKYDTNGREIWTKQFGTEALDLAITSKSDSSGVYVAGIVGGGLLGGQTLEGQTSAGGMSDAFVAKYDKNGEELWIRQFGTPGLDIAIGIDLDSTGVYIAGVGGASFAGSFTFEGQEGEGGLSDAFVRKYNKDGKELWTHQFGTAGLDVATGVSVDSYNIFLVGLAGGGLVEGQTFEGETSSGNADAFVISLGSIPDLKSFLEETRKPTREIVTTEDDVQALIIAIVVLFVVMVFALYTAIRSNKNRN